MRGGPGGHEVREAEQHSRAIRRWLIGYIALLFGSLPFALAVWRTVLMGSVGRFVTVEQLHVAQYSVLGWLGGRYADAVVSPPWHRGLLVVCGAGIGLLDETVQRWLPGRFFDWSDVGWNLAGVALGLSLSAGWEWLKRVVDLER